MALAKFGDELFSDRFRLVSVLGDRRVAAWEWRPRNHTRLHSGICLEMIDKS